MISAPDFVVFVLFCVLINGLVFFIYAHDKMKAKKNSWRAPENLTLFSPRLDPLEPVRR